MRKEPSRGILVITLRHPEDSSTSHRTTTAYTPSGLVSHVQDPLNRVTSYGYDPTAPLLKTVTSPMGFVSSYGYDTSMRQVAQSLPSGATATTVYDERGLTAAIVNPLGHRTSYGYDDDSRNITQTNSLNQVKTNTFDNDGRLTKMSYASMAPVSYGYDARGLVTLIQDQVGSTTNTWDACGQLTLRQSVFGAETMQYDPVRNRTLYQSTSGVRYTSAYDAVNRETTLTFGSKVHAAQYDAIGQAQTETYSSGTEVRRGYESRGYMTTLIQDHNSGPTSTIISTYDAAGRKTLSVRDGVATTNTYDGDDRLTLQNRPNFVASFAYDQDTNLTSAHHQGSNPITFTSNSLGQVVTSIQGSTVTTNTWDNAGRNTLQNVGGTQTARTWDQEDRLIQQELVGSESLHEFLYRYDNLRVQSEFGEVTTDQYIWDSGGVRRIIGSEGNDLAVFNGQIVEATDREYLSDELGHITAWAIDEAASLTLIEYWPYGDVQSGILPQEGLGYMGAYSVTRKPFSDLLYAQQRWLKPSAGRFLSVDPYWPGELAYMYAWGGPTLGSDPDGRAIRYFGCAGPHYGTLSSCCEKLSRLDKDAVAKCLRRISRGLPLLDLGVLHRILSYISNVCGGTESDVCVFCPPFSALPESCGPVNLDKGMSGARTLLSDSDSPLRDLRLPQVKQHLPSWYGEVTFNYCSNGANCLADLRQMGCDGAVAIQSSFDPCGMLAHELIHVAGLTTSRHTHNGNRADIVYAIGCCICQQITDPSDPWGCACTGVLP